MCAYAKKRKEKGMCVCVWMSLNIDLISTTYLLPFPGTRWLEVDVGFTPWILIPTFEPYCWVCIVQSRRFLKSCAVHYMQVDSV